MLVVDGLKKIAPDASSLPLAEMKEHTLHRVAALRHGHDADDASLVLPEGAWRGVKSLSLSARRQAGF